MEKSFEEEKKYLTGIVDRFNELIDDTELRIKNLPNMYSDNLLLMNNLLKQNSDRLASLKKTKNKPYFARINFKSDDQDKILECYIGKVGIYDDDNNIVTVDWRAPISSMYYDSNVGRASYEAPTGIIKGNLITKRQYEIENKKLISFQDVDTVSNDEILKPYLGVSADNRLKNIVSTIQSEQNEIIREKIYNNTIVQGVAGSGKTTVALHRIAYLVYNNMNDIDPSEYLVIGPNKFFVNYISGVLPDLDVKNVSQLTYDEMVSNLVKENIELLPDDQKLRDSIKDYESLNYERFKVSMEFKKIIDKFLNEFDKSILPDKPLSIKGYNILSKSSIERIYNKVDDSIIDYDVLSKKVEKANLFIQKYIKDNSSSLISKVNIEYYRRTLELNKKERELELKNKEYVLKEIRNNCNQSIKAYFSASRPKILLLYIKLLSSLNNYVNIDNYEDKIKKNISNIKKKKVEFEDLAALLYLAYKIYGSGDYENIRHAVVDESQDFGKFNFYALKVLMPKSTFSIFGDLSQSIFQFRGVKNWESVIRSTFNNNCNMKYLKKSYRTTAEIMYAANNITSYLNEQVAEPVIRHGLPVNYIKLNNNKIELIIDILNAYKEKDYSSIAIISKDENESLSIYNELINKGIKVGNITDADKSYNGGFCTITSSLAKGLEFDGVIISDASNNNFNSEKIIDMKLLYVSMTRPLHELTIMYEGDISKPLEKELKK